MCSAPSKSNTRPKMWVGQRHQDFDGAVEQAVQGGGHDTSTTASPIPVGPVSNRLCSSTQYNPRTGFIWTNPTYEVEVKLLLIK
jgi:hypothetical protein